MLATPAIVTNTAGTMLVRAVIAERGMRGLLFCYPSPYPLDFCFHGVDGEGGRRSLRSKTLAVRSLKMKGLVGPVVTCSSNVYFRTVFANSQIENRRRADGHVLLEL